MQAQTPGKRLPFLLEDILSWALAASGACMLLLAGLLAPDWAVAMIAPACAVAALASCALLAKSIRDFSRTGPAVRKEITGRYRWYGAYALARLTSAAFGLALFWSIPGTVIAVAVSDTLELNFACWVKLAAAALSLLAATIYAGCRALLLNPGLIVASWQYRTARVHRLWSALTPKGLRLIAQSLVLTGLAAVAALAVLRTMHGDFSDAFALLFATLGYGAIVAFALWEPEGKSPPARGSERPNIVMIGSDTLRADRIGAERDGRSLTPNIDRLAARGTQFTACYVPCARTAPSLISLLTGLWPHRHGVRDNFVSEAEAHLDFDTLPKVLRERGYRTAAVSDWCGADLGKFPFGFDVLQLPEDQWNLKYLIRQGPKDIRLFISLFAQNRIGRLVLPEIYYLGGVPQTYQLGRRSRHLITRLAATKDPFLVNVFYSTTHPPFASEYPYYVRHAKADYKGESKFAMARLTEPFEIIRRQGEPREEFDLDQILDLYDGCVAQFDDEVGRIMQHLDSLGLSENTIVVLYSDHGMEFFEHGTWGQGNSALGDFSARVPLIVSAPGMPIGTRVESVTRTIDFLPTILDLLGAPPVACDGTSLVSAMKDPASDLQLKAFNETGVWITPPPGLPEGHLQYPSLLELLDVPDDASGTLALKTEFRELILAAKDRMVRDGDWKLVYQPLTSGKRLTLYNLSSDPGCNCDVSELYPEETARLWAELDAWIKDDTLPSNNDQHAHEEARSVA
ncbi:MAG: sulfatase [Proteobacteria bacterium]|nr:sulfatase [Pseudomonadota bacterium]